MATFDVYLGQIAEYVAQLRGEGREVTQSDYPGSIDGLMKDLPTRVGARSSTGVILRGDTFVELGHPEAGSCAFLVWTEDTGRIRDGRITLIGPDIPESGGASLPFAQILMVGGKELQEKDHEAIVDAQVVADQIEGYMLRSSSQNIWSRVSRDAAGRGFCFDILGRALMVLFKSRIPKVEAMEVLFVTSSREDVCRLDGISAQVRKIGKEIVKENWKIRGYDIECDLDCNSCDEKAVCDGIREMLAWRKEKDEQGSATGIS